MKNPNPYAMLFVGVCVVSTVVILVRLTDAPAFVVAFYRMFLAALILLPLNMRRFRDLMGIKKRDLAVMFAMGLVLGVHFAFWFASIKLTSIASSVVLVSTHPIMVVLITFFVLRGRILKREVGGSIMAVIGIGIIVFSGWGAESSFTGNTFALLGSLTLAVYFIGGKNLRSRVNLLPYTFVVYGTASIFLFALARSSGFELTGYPLKDYVIVLALAVGPTLFGHSLFIYCLRYFKASQVSVSLLGEPIGGSILAFVLFYENPGLLSIIGGGVTLLGVYISLSKGSALTYLRGLFSAWKGHQR